MGPAMRRPARMRAEFFGGGDAVFGGDGDLVAVALEKFSEAALGFAVAVHGGDVEVADAGVVGGLRGGGGSRGG